MVEELGGGDRQRAPGQTRPFAGEKGDRRALEQHAAYQGGACRCRHALGDGDRNREVGAPLGDGGDGSGTPQHLKGKDSGQFPREGGEPRRDQMNERPLAARHHDLLLGGDPAHLRADARFAGDHVPRPTEHAPSRLGERERSAAALVKGLPEGGRGGGEAAMHRRLGEAERLTGAREVAVGFGKRDEGAQRLKIHEENYRRSR